MPLISRSGSSTPPLNPQTPPPLPPNPFDVLESLPIVRNPALDRMAFDTEQYPNATAAIQGYMQGNRLSVTYYMQQGTGGSDIRTNIADSLTERHLLHTAYICIQNFEITLKDAWTFNYDPTTTESSVTGEALLYPGVNPLINDVFLTSGGDNKLALFKVTSVTPLSWRNERCYQITFSFYKFPQTQDLQFYTDATIQNLFFDKANYLDSTVSVLEEDLYVNLVTLRDMRVFLARYYFNTFYNDAYDTYMPPIDGLFSAAYDPYVVRFMAAKCPFELIKRRPRQLQSNVEQTFGSSIWGRMLERRIGTWSDVWTSVSTNTFIGRTLDVNLTPLLNQSYLVLIANNDPNWENYNPLPVPYVLSAAFYANNTTLMTPFEVMFASALANRVWTDSTTLINSYLNTYASLTPAQQFYMIPLYLHMIDITIDSISRVV